MLAGVAFGSPAALSLSMRNRWPSADNCRKAAEKTTDGLPAGLWDDPARGKDPTPCEYGCVRCGVRTVSPPPPHTQEHDPRCFIFIVLFAAVAGGPYLVSLMSDETAGRVLLMYQRAGY
jgi:hypothetical protein